MINNILVLTEPDIGDQKAIAKAVEIARSSNARVHVVVNTYEPTDFYDESSYSGQPVADTRVTVVDEDSELAPDRHGQDIAISYQTISEKYAQHWLLQHCLPQQDPHSAYDLIIQQLHHDEHDSLGASDWELFRAATVPVYSITDRPPEDADKVLVALDVMSQSSAKQQLNAKLLKTASQLSRTVNQPLHVCAVIPIPRLIKELDPAAFDQRKRQALATAHSRSKQLLTEAGIDLDPACIHIEAGVPARQLAYLAERLKASCMVIGSMGRKGLTGKLFGNTSEKVIQRVPSDLLVVNPDV